MKKTKHCFATNLERILGEKGYTVEEFSEKTGIRKGIIEQYLEGKRECDFDTLITISEALKCPIDSLLKAKIGVGYIYILVNKSFPKYVKIGYANNVETRLKSLNGSECVPFSFQVYATYEVTKRLSDKNVHSIIDRLNPGLRSIEVMKGKKREREFYEITPEFAYSLLEAIAEINGHTDRLALYDIIDEDEEAEERKAFEERKEGKKDLHTDICENDADGDGEEDIDQEDDEKGGKKRGNNARKPQKAAK